MKRPIQSTGKLNVLYLVLVHEFLSLCAFICWDYFVRDIAGFVCLFVCLLLLLLLLLFCYYYFFFIIIFFFLFFFLLLCFLVVGMDVGMGCRVVVILFYCFFRECFVCQCDVTTWLVLIRQSDGTLQLERHDAPTFSRVSLTPTRSRRSSPARCTARKQSIC